MSWLELDDRILEHPKFIRAVKLGGSEAVHLWLGIRAYCGQNLTDGFVPADMVDEIRGPSVAKKRKAAFDALVSVGLIDIVEGGIAMHDYLSWSASREQVLLRRAVGNSRSALRANDDLMQSVKARDCSRCRYCASLVDWKNHRGPGGGTYDHVTPLSRGGTNSIDNVVVACRACNARKRDRLLEESGMTLLPVDYPVTNQLPTGSQSVDLPTSSSTPLQSPTTTNTGSGAAVSVAERARRVLENPYGGQFEQPSKWPEILHIGVHLAHGLVVKFRDTPNSDSDLRVGLEILAAGHSAEEIELLGRRARESDYFKSKGPWGPASFTPAVIRRLLSETQREPATAPTTQLPKGVKFGAEDLS